MMKRSPYVLVQFRLLCLSVANALLFRKRKIENVMLNLLTSLTYTEFMNENERRIFVNGCILLFFLSGNVIFLPTAAGPLLLWATLIGLYVISCIVGLWVAQGSD